MFYITGKPTLLELGTEVYIHYKILYKFALASLFGDEDTDIQALPASVNFRCLNSPSSLLFLVWF